MQSSSTAPNTKATALPRASFDLEPAATTICWHTIRLRLHLPSACQSMINILSAGRVAGRTLGSSRVKSQAVESVLLRLECFHCSSMPICAGQGHVPGSGAGGITVLRWAVS